MKCPKCNMQGQRVGVETVKSLLKPKYRNKVQGNDYYLCMNSECNVSYYSSDSCFDKSGLRKPLWYKKDAEPKYACYCRKISQDEVTRAVKEAGLTDVDSIMLNLRGEMKSNCKLNNPTGSCCHKAFNEMIEIAKKRLTK